MEKQRKSVNCIRNREQREWLQKQREEASETGKICHLGHFLQVLVVPNDIVKNYTRKDRVKRYWKRPNQFKGSIKKTLVRSKMGSLVCLVAPLDSHCGF